MALPPCSAAAAGVLKLAGAPTTGVPGGGGGGEGGEGGRIASFTATAVRSASDNGTADLTWLAGGANAVITTCGGGVTACCSCCTTVRCATTFSSAWATLFESLLTTPTCPVTAATVAERCIPTGGAGVGSTAARPGVGPGDRLGGALPSRFPTASHPTRPHAATPPSTTAHCVPGMGATENRGLTRRSLPPLLALRVLGSMRRIPVGKA